MVNCKECKVDFEPKNKKGVFCSNKCRQKDYRKSMAKLAKMARENWVTVKDIHTITAEGDNKVYFKKIWKSSKNKKEDNSPYDGFKGKSFTQEAYDAGLQVQIGDDVFQKEKSSSNKKPEKLKGENGVDYAIRLAEWKEK